MNKKMVYSIKKVDKQVVVVHFHKSLPHAVHIYTIYSASIVPVPWDGTLLEVSGYAFFGCDLLIQKITTNIIATMAIINTAAPTAAPIITPLTDSELLSLLTADVDYNIHTIIRLQKFI